MTTAAAPPPPDRDPRMELLRREPWARLGAQLTAIAFKRIRGRSMDDAKDLAQTAISDAHQSLARGGWDPEKGPLMGYLVGRIVGMTLNERKRKRNTCEVWLDEEYEEESGTVRRHEKFLAADQPAPDEALHRLRFASTFAERLALRLAGNELALSLVALMKDGVSKPAELAAALGRPEDDVEVRAARRQIRYHAGEVTKELSAAAVPARPASTRTTKEVTQ
jgi:DNA-directed RNA polymerase specialized sigma24 family protein